jgi:hypothetical protein
MAESKCEGRRNLRTWKNAQPTLGVIQKKLPPLLYIRDGCFPKRKFMPARYLFQIKGGSNCIPKLHVVFTGPRLRRPFAGLKVDPTKMICASKRVELNLTPKRQYQGASEFFLFLHQDSLAVEEQLAETPFLRSAKTQKAVAKS